MTVHGSTDAFPVLSFRHEWRPYQQRVLGAIDEHLSDKRLHVVAAPGAGKTSLGLEIFRRLRRRALVLSPTRVIRDQWVRRLGDFIDGGGVQPPGWVSTSLERPAIFTSVTYQALHTRVADDLSADTADDAETDPAAPGDTQIEAFVAALRVSGIELLLLDEAHHLRAEWWRALERICAALPELVLVSLTATPPYDTDAHEWHRYERLCGPIDEEISVPELVQTGTLYYHAVPLPLAVRKEHALTFHRAWTAHVGPSELIYTRDAAGRSRLLRARALAFSTAFAGQAKRQDRWVAA